MAQLCAGIVKPDCVIAAAVDGLIATSTGTSDVERVESVPETLSSLRPLPRPPPWAGFNVESSTQYPAMPLPGPRIVTFCACRALVNQLGFVQPLPS